MPNKKVALRGLFYYDGKPIENKRFSVSDYEEMPSVINNEEVVLTWDFREKLEKICFHCEQIGFYCSVLVQKYRGIFALNYYYI